MPGSTFSSLGLRIQKHWTVHHCSLGLPLSLLVSQDCHAEDLHFHYDHLTKKTIKKVKPTSDFYQQKANSEQSSELKILFILVSQLEIQQWFALSSIDYSSSSLPVQNHNTIEMLSVASLFTPRAPTTGTCTLVQSDCPISHLLERQWDRLFLGFAPITLQQ